MAIVYGTLVTINIIWPRNSIYNVVGKPHWYWQWAPFLFIGAIIILGTIYYYTVQVKKGSEILAEHRAGVPPVTATEPIPAPLGDAAP